MKMCHLLRFPVLSSSPPYAESCFLGSWVHSFYPVLNKNHAKYSSVYLFFTHITYQLTVVFHGGCLEVWGIMEMLVWFGASVTMLSFP